MWGALLAASLTGWLHQLTATPAADGSLLGHGVRDGQAMIATLRHRLIRVPARLVRHAGTLILRLPPGLRAARRGPRPHPRPARHVLTPAIPAPNHPEPRSPEATLGPSRCPTHRNPQQNKITPAEQRSSTCYSRIRV